VWSTQRPHPYWCHPGAVNIQISLAHHMWMTWLQVGAERECAAARARERGVELGPGKGLGDALSEEMRASMVAVSAAAHAIDALYGEVRPMVPIPAATTAAWASNGTPRHRRIFETLKLGCRLAAGLTRGLLSSMRCTCFAIRSSTTRSGACRRCRTRTA
jgi:hypothetical protein